MNDENPKLKKWIIIAIVILVAIIILLPYIVEWLYYHVEAPCAFFDIQMEPDAIVQYFGAVLAFFATVVLGVLTLHQNRMLQKKTDEINEKNLEIAKSNMERAIRREQEDAEAKKIKLKFETRIQGYNGSYVNAEISIRNLTEYFVSDFKILSVEILDEGGSLIETVNVSRFKTLAFQPAEIKTIKLENKKALQKVEEKRNYQSKYTPFHNVKFKMKFECQDSDYRKHYFEAVKNIVSTDKHDSEPWQCQEVATD